MRQSGYTIYMYRVHVCTYSRNINTTCPYRDKTVVDINPLANLEDLGQVLIVQIDGVCGALLLEGVICGQLDLITSVQSNLFATVILFLC